MLSIFNLYSTIEMIVTTFHVSFWIVREVWKRMCVYD